MQFLAVLFIPSILHLFCSCFPLNCTFCAYIFRFCCMYCWPAPYLYHRSPQIRISLQISHAWTLFSNIICLYGPERVIQRVHTVSSVVAYIVMCSAGYVSPYRENTTVSKRWAVPCLLSHFWNVTDNILPSSKLERWGCVGEGEGAWFQSFLRNRHFIQMVLFLMFCFKQLLFFLSFHLFLPSPANCPPQKKLYCHRSLDSF